MFKFSDKSFPSSQFFVVHRSKSGTLGSAVAGSNDEKTANEDALERNRKAKEMGLDCSYVVKPRSEGGGV